MRTPHNNSTDQQKPVASTPLHGGRSMRPVKNIGEILLRK